MEQSNSQRELIGVVLQHCSFIAAASEYLHLEQNLKNTAPILIRDRLVEERAQRGEVSGMGDQMYPLSIRHPLNMMSQRTDDGLKRHGIIVDGMPNSSLALQRKPMG